MAKILVTTMALDIGGAETHIAALTRELCARGHEVTVVSAGGVYVRDILAAGARHIDAPLNTRAPAAMLRALRILRRAIRDARPDVVHAHARIPAFLCGILWRAMPKRRRFRFVTTAHWVFSAAGLTRFLSDWGEKTLAVSEDIKRYLLENYKVRAEDIFVTVNGIDTAAFTPGLDSARIRAELGLPEDAFVVTSVSRLDATAGDGARALAEAAPELARRIRNVRVVIVGGNLDGTAFERDLRALADAVNADAGYALVTMTGPRTDVPDLLAAADLFVGVSRAALEALAMELPTVLAGGEGYLGLFTPDKRAAAVETNLCCRGCGATSPEKLTRDISEYFANREQYTTLGAFGREFVREGYSVARVTEDCLAAYDAAGTPRARAPRVVMSGYYGFGNAGDEAILQSVHASVEAAGGGEVTVLSKNPRATRKTYGYNAAHRFNPFAVVRAVARADALVFGGGSLLQDHTSTRSLLYYLMILRLARVFGKRVMIYANGIGPVSRPSNRRRVARAVSRAAVVTLRDDASRDELIRMGVPPQSLTVTSDPVFTMPPPEPRERRDITAKLGLTRPYIVLTVRSGAPARLYAELAALADALVRRAGRSVVFLPMQLPGDLDASRNVARRMECPATVLGAVLTARENLALLGEADAALSMRLHTLIFAARMGTPLTGVNIDPKLEAFLRAVDMPCLDAPAKLDAERAYLAVSRLLENRDAHAARLAEAAEANAARCACGTELLRELLRG
ncbi:MAG: polysaccharide pyruvyl transferase CsaB [Oscillospiraceae bacterium]|jgi:polysaccharide pyruvyl transferase CsaB|nr:polysaccharide pyruvyl transferase CsaB [Oscillospiraceae bacterium]